MSSPPRDPDERRPDPCREVTASLPSALSDIDLLQYLKSGDTVLIGQATAEPTHLVHKLIEAAPVVENITAICGYTLSDVWSDVGAGGLAVKSYVAHGALRRLSGQARLDIFPWHLSSVERDIATGRLAVDVVMLQVGPKDVNGYYSLGATVDYTAAAAERARVVLIQVNPNMPRTHSTRRLHESRVTATLEIRDELAISATRPASEAEVRVAQRIATLVPSGATLQLGLGALPVEVARRLSDRVGLTVRSGLIGDWLVELYEAGAMAPGYGSTTTGMALGTRRLYDFIDRNDRVVFAPTSEILASDKLRECVAYVAVNSAVEVDLLGQVNSEVVGGRYVGAVGGQVDFFRATRQAATGLAVVAITATDPGGDSRVVPQLSGPVTSLKSDIDVVVTEWGVADLRAASLQQRAAALIEIAAPEHRDALRNSQFARFSGERFSR